LGIAGVNGEGSVISVSEWQWVAADIPPQVTKEMMIFLLYWQSKLLALLLLTRSRSALRGSDERTMKVRLKRVSLWGVE
jgi:hypothetical protein